MSAAQVELLPDGEQRARDQGPTFAHRLAELRRRLRTEFADLTVQTVDAAIEAGCALTAKARVETFRIVFVERHARASLARLQGW